MNIFFCLPPGKDSEEEMCETPQMYLDAWVLITQQTIREARAWRGTMVEDGKPGLNAVAHLEELDRILQQGYNTTVKGGFQHTNITREAVANVRKDRWCITHPLVSDMLNEMDRVGFIRSDGKPYPDEKTFKKIT